MPNFHFSPSSLSKLEGVDPRLQFLAKEVLSISPIDFAITSGLRTKEEQYKLYKEGKSKCDGINTLSKHQSKRDRGLPLTNTYIDDLADAIDICPCIYDDKLKKSILDYEATEDLFFLIGLFYIKAKELAKEALSALKSNNIYDLSVRLNLNDRNIAEQFAEVERLSNLKIRLGAFWDCNSIKENRIKNNEFVDGYHIEIES
ncbi:MAG: hypothetical protein LBG48_00905 [Rickettsiales bacterium]|jgi:hypothetical protein|nr:hypothetical protein [Rickettsiales bacterium]